MSTTKRNKKNVSHGINQLNNTLPRNWIGIILGILAFILYSGTINHGFVLDDGLVTTLNKYVLQGVDGLWDIFTHSYRAGSSITTDSEYMYRPLSVMMFAIEWEFFPNNSIVHHLINVLFYSISIFLVFNLLVKLLPDQPLSISIATALIFLVHPIHTEVVSNIKSRDEIMCFFFGLLTIQYIFKYFDNKLWSLPLACLMFSLSLLSKEGAVLFLAIIPLTIYYFKREKFIKPTLYLGLTFILWFILRNYVLGNFKYEIDVNDNQLVGLTRPEQWATSMVVLWYYLKLLIWPYPLSWDYSFSTFTNYNWKEILPYSSLIIHLGLFVFAMAKLKSKNIFSYCIFAYFISLSLYTNLFILIGTLMGERLIYLASLWYCLALILLISRLLKVNIENIKKLNGYSFYGITATITIIFSILTYMRASDWKDSFTLFSKDVLNNPNSFRTHQAMGDESLQKFMKLYTNADDSVKYIRLAEKHHGLSASILKNFSNQVGLGNAYLIQNKYREALPMFESAQKFKDGKIIQERIRTTCYRYGISYARDSNNLIKAEELLQRAYELDSSQVELMSDLGMVYGMGRNFNKALYYFNKAHQLKPHDPTIINNLANTYYFLGNKTKSEELFRKISK